MLSTQADGVAAAPAGTARSPAASPPAPASGSAAAPGSIRRPARISALFLLGLAVAAGFEASTLDRWSWDGPGPGLLPQLLTVLIGAAAIAVLIWPGEGAPEGGAASPLRSRTFLVYAAGMLGTALALPVTGFIPAGFLAVALMLRLGEGRPWGAALAWAAVLMLSVTLLFGTALGVPFPAGPVEQGLARLGLLRAG
jgi:putative tricarboxylic transport membrane protein